MRVREVALSVGVGRRRGSEGSRVSEVGGIGGVRWAAGVRVIST